MSPTVARMTSSGVVNPITNVDLRLMDVIGYDRVTPTPEPSTIMLLGAGSLPGRREQIYAIASRGFG